MTSYKCKAMGCYTIIDHRGYCEAHSHLQVEKPEYQKAVKKPFENAERPNASLYNTAQWRALRSSTIKNQPYCTYCGGTKGLQVHHRVPPKGDEGT